MHRPTSWYPLAATDPVPGDPAAVAQDAQDHRTISDEILAAASSLDVLTADAGMQSLAVREVRNRSLAVAESIRSVRDRYVAVAEALETYAVALRHAQEAADDLLVRARTTQQALDEADQQRLRALMMVCDLEDDPTAEQADIRTMTNRLSAARSAVDDAELRLAGLRDELDVITRERDAAAQRAIDMINTARAEDGLDDGWWHDWGHDVATRVSAVAGKVATVAGTASLVLGWVPFLGPALALTATLAGAASLVSNLLLAYHGEKGWTDAGMDALGMVSFGWGKAVGRGLRTLSREMPDALTAARGLVNRSGHPAVSDARAAAAVNAATRGWLPTGGLTLRGLFSNGWRAAPDTYRSAFRAAAFQVGAGPNALLAMAGRGDVIANRVLLEDVASAVVHKDSVAAINPLLAKASSLEQQVVWIHGIDVATNAYGVGQLTTALTSPPAESARERLRL